MDEPTAHLDLQYQVEMMQLIQDLARKEGLAVVLALHDLNLVARYADQVALLTDGRLWMSGEPRDVLTSAMLSKAFRVPVKVHYVDKNTPPYIVAGQD